MNLHLTRISDNGIQTIGRLDLLDFAGNVLLSFDTLELGFHNNERQISCICSGVYVIKHHFSVRHGNCFALQNVVGRDNILIHAGNFNKDTKGCILIGHGFKDINNDGELDVLNSKLAMKNLLGSVVPTTTITISYQWVIL